eukprot:COSAG01_NODE_1989_length_8706_cov_7.443476_5_plen_62_part_00
MLTASRQLTEAEAQPTWAQLTCGCILGCPDVQARGCRYKSDYYYPSHSLDLLMLLLTHMIT